MSVFRNRVSCFGSPLVGKLMVLFKHNFLNSAICGGWEGYSPHFFGEHKNTTVTCVATLIMTVIAVLSYYNNNKE